MCQCCVYSSLLLLNIWWNLNVGNTTWILYGLTWELLQCVYTCMYNENATFQASSLCIYIYEMNNHHSSKQSLQLKQSLNMTAHRWPDSRGQRSNHECFRRAAAENHDILRVNRASAHLLNTCGREAVCIDPQSPRHQLPFPAVRAPTGTFSTNSLCLPFVNLCHKQSPPHITPLI